jgi:hypothetical protein
MKKLIQLSKVLSDLNFISESKTIRGLMKSAVPLDDIVDVDSHKFRQKRSPIEPTRLSESWPSIGHGMSQNDIQLAKKIMEKTKDHWVFLSFDRTQAIGQEVRSDEFADWLKKKNYPEDYKILIIADKPLKGDFVSVGWILHDIIGHSASNIFNKMIKAKLSINESADDFCNIEGVKEILEAIWDRLPPAMQNSKGTGFSETADKISDIVASIIFEDLTKDVAIMATKDLAEDAGRDYKKTEIINKLFESADIWLESLEKSAIKVGRNSVNIVSPWQTWQD